MNHLICKIISLGITAPYTLELKFNDGAIKEINFERMLFGEMFSPLIKRSSKWEILQNNN